jgi:TOBE domain
VDIPDRIDAEGVRGSNPLPPTTLGDGQEVTAAITREAVQDLALAAGDRVTVLVKATEVMLAKD